MRTPSCCSTKPAPAEITIAMAAITAKAAEQAAPHAPSRPQEAEDLANTTQPELHAPPRPLPKEENASGSIAVVG